MDKIRTLLLTIEDNYRKLQDLNERLVWYNTNDVASKAGGQEKQNQSSLLLSAMLFIWLLAAGSNEQCNWLY